MAAVVTLAAFAEDVCRRVPPNLLACERLESEQPYGKWCPTAGIDGLAHLRGAQSRAVRARQTFRTAARGPTTLRRPAGEMTGVSSPLSDHPRAGFPQSTHLCDDGLVGEALADCECDRHGRSFVAGAVAGRAVRQRDGDRFAGHTCRRGTISSPIPYALFPS